MNHSKIGLSTEEIVKVRDYIKDNQPVLVTKVKAMIGKQHQSIGNFLTTLSNYLLLYEEDGRIDAELKIGLLKDGIYDFRDNGANGKEGNKKRAD